MPTELSQKERKLQCTVIFADSRLQTPNFVGGQASGSLHIVECKLQTLHGVSGLAPTILASLDSNKGLKET